MKQCAITVIAPLDATDFAHARHHLQELAAAQGELVRKAMFDACKVCAAQGAEVRCQRCERRIHFLSFFAFPDPAPVAKPTTEPAFVVLELNGDGSARTLLRRLAERARPFLEQLFKHCKDCPKSNSDAKVWFKFLHKHDHGADAFYMANPGRSVEQIALEKTLRERAQSELAAKTRAVDCGAVWSALRTRMETQLRAATPAPRLPLRMRWGTHRKGMFKQLPGYGRLLRSMLGALLLAVIVWRGCEWLRAAPSWQRTAALVAPWLIAPTWMLPIWLKERPVHASPAYKRTSWWIFAKAYLSAGIKLSLALALIATVEWLWSLPFAQWQPILLTLAAALPALLGLALAAVIGVFVGLAMGKYGGYVAALLTAAGWLVFTATSWTEPHRLWIVWSIATTISAIIMAALVAWFFAKLRVDEANDEDPAVSYDLPRLDANTQHEDVGLQNHLATVTELRPEPIRHYALKVVLRAVSLLATVHFNQGTLDSITSIHFARFLIFSSGTKRWLLFMGNYDGGFNAYLGAFAPVPGTTAVWSCTKEFPKTLGLIWDGARDEQRFKAFGRKSQVQTLGWFSAYPELSTQDVSAGTATRMALQRVPTGHRVPPAWRRLTAALFGPPGAFEAEIRGPFDEAACDAAVRRL